MAFSQTLSTRPRAAFGVRVFDFLVASLLLLPGLPLLLWAVAWRRARGLGVFEAVHIVAGSGKTVALRQFAGVGPWRTYPGLFNVLRGDLCWLGNDIQFALGAPNPYPAVPGLCPFPGYRNAWGWASRTRIPWRWPAKVVWAAICPVWRGHCCACC